jgi:cellulose synthase/poly-beta-1,6-N-acetylglucosamine synthase-like glycosyltransferase
MIQKKIENSLALDYPKDKLEIIIASEAVDKTNQIVQGYKEKGVKLFAYQGREGKQYSIYRALPDCKGEIIALSDANAMIRKDALKKLVRGFVDPKIGCVCGKLVYINPQKNSIGENEGLYWKYENLVKKLESGVRSVLGAAGSLYTIRKSLYSPLSKYRGDDFDIPIRVKQQGYGVVFEPKAVSEEEIYSSHGKDFNRKVVIVGWHSRNAFMLLKESVRRGQFLLIFQMISHKILRWLVGLFLFFVFVFNLFLITNPFYLFLFFCQIVFYSLALIGYWFERRGKKSGKIIALAYYFVLVNLAALIGMKNGIFDKQTATWEKMR